MGCEMQDKALSVVVGLDFEDYKFQFRRFMILFPKAILRRVFGVSPRRIPEVMVVTPGGAGSTTLIAHIGKFKSVNDCNDADGLKHMLFPPRWLRSDSDVRVIFVDRSPDKIVASLERRGFLYEQLAKLGSIRGCLTSVPKARLQMMAALDCQKQNWRDAKLKNVMYVEYDELWQSTDRIAAFLGTTDVRFVSDFPRRLV